jgi:hypothetical protein
MYILIDLLLSHTEIWNEVEFTTENVVMLHSLYRYGWQLVTRQISTKEEEVQFKKSFPFGI